MISTIITACVIHNLCIMSNDELDGNFVMYDGDIPQLQPHVQNYDANAQQDGHVKDFRLHATYDYDYGLFE